MPSAFDAVDLVVALGGRRCPCCRKGIVHVAELDSLTAVSCDSCDAVGRALLSAARIPLEALLGTTRDHFLVGAP